MKILLVEDEAALAGMLNKGLKEAGYEVTVAPDGLIGHEMAVKNQFDIDSRHYVAGSEWHPVVQAITAAVSLPFG